MNRDFWLRSMSMARIVREARLLSQAPLDGMTSSRGLLPACWGLGRPAGARPALHRAVPGTPPQRDGGSEEAGDWRPPIFAAHQSAQSLGGMA